MGSEQCAKKFKGKRTKFSLSPRLVELENDFKQSGGAWREFRIGELFEVATPKKRFDANKIQFGGAYAYVARGRENNGIRGYIDEDLEFLNPANTISFGQDTATMFYQTQPYFTGDKIKIFSFKKGVLNRYNANFLIASMQKAFSNFSWGSTSFKVEALKNVVIFLPVYENNIIAFDYMESYIQELERERIQELEAYLRVAGFKDTKLNDKEKEALQVFNDSTKSGGGGQLVA